MMRTGDRAVVSGHLLTIGSLRDRDRAGTVRAHSPASESSPSLDTSVRQRRIRHPRRAVACTSAPAGTPSPSCQRDASLGAPDLCANPLATPGQPTPTPTPSPSPPSASASVTPPGPTASGYPAGSVIVTFKVGPEQYRVLVIDPAHVAIAQELLAGGEAPGSPTASSSAATRASTRAGLAHRPGLP